MEPLLRPLLLLLPGKKGSSATVSIASHQQGSFSGLPQPVTPLLGQGSNKQSRCLPAQGQVRGLHPPLWFPQPYSSLPGCHLNLQGGAGDGTG